MDCGLKRSGPLAEAAANHDEVSSDVMHLPTSDAIAIVEGAQIPVHMLHRHLIAKLLPGFRRHSGTETRSTKDNNVVRCCRLIAAVR